MKKILVAMIAGFFATSTFAAVSASAEAEASKKPKTAIAKGGASSPSINKTAASSPSINKVPASVTGASGASHGNAK